MKSKSYQFLVKFNLNWQRNCFYILPKTLKVKKMLASRGNSITYEKWTEAMSKEIFIQKEERSSVFNKLYDKFGDDFEEEESRGSRSRNK